jgi:hypothetical protein
VPAVDATIQGTLVKIFLSQSVVAVTHDATLAAASPSREPFQHRKLHTALSTHWITRFAETGSSLERSSDKDKALIWPTITVIIRFGLLQWENAAEQRCSSTAFHSSQIASEDDLQNKHQKPQVLTLACAYSVVGPSLRCAIVHE